MKIDDVTPGFRAAYCGRTGFIVPHAHNAESPNDFKFWRVPETCPRPDAEVEKRAVQQPEKHWQTVTITAP
jgi:hypothetical protein